MKMLEMLVFRRYYWKQPLQRWTIATQPRQTMERLKRKEFIHVLPYFMGWKLKRKGILTPNLKDPLRMQNTRYWVMIMNQMTPMKLAFCPSNQTSKSSTTPLSFTPSTYTSSLNRLNYLNITSETTTER